jgi:MFS family permease
MQDGRVRYARLFHNQSFVALWLGQTVSFVGDYFYFLAIPIMVERLTGSALQVGLSVIVTTIPMLLLGPVAGVFVDRWDRKRTMVAADLLRGLLVLVCLVVQRPDQVWIYYVVGFLMSCISRFFFPAQNAVLPLIVGDEDDLLAANGLMQIVQTVGFLIGPALAGFSIGLWGAQVAFLVDSVTYLVSAAAIVTITVPSATAGQPVVGRDAALDRSVSSVWSEMRDGVVYLLGNRTMVGVLLCLSVVQLGVGAIHVIWVPFMQRVFGIGAEGLGAVDASQGLGMALGAVTTGFLAARFTKKNLAGWGIAFIGGMIALVGLAPSFSLVNLVPGIQADAALTDMTVGQRLLHMPLLLLAYSFLLGVALVPAQSSLMTMMQLAVPDLKRGRVSSALNALTTAAGLVSMAVAAAAGEVVALRLIYVTAGLITSVAGLLGLLVLQEPEVQAKDVAPDSRGTIVGALPD